MKYIHYMPKNLTLIAFSVFGASIFKARSGRIYEVSDDYIISYNKFEYPL